MRLDLDWRWHEKALELGCIFSINPDAHSIPELDHMHWGVEMARKGGVSADRVLNAMALPKLIAHLSKRKTGLARRRTGRRSPAQDAPVRELAPAESLSKLLASQPDVNDSDGSSGSYGQIAEPRS
ncbi:hypothetical protein GGQ85_003110 [Nitrobacter vulgaris]|nr:hypothetical protein [Nitrobacter vulgaris]